ncbi:MAG TPA: cytochrome c [Vicinamibacterales bacterium]|nr:cytochrome c [Vicinamibacterales bacterium]
MTAGSFPRGSSVRVALAVSACLSFAAPALAADTPAKPTFSKDVAPIFQAKCQECHQPNSIAPMSLITYQDARPWARSIKERVATRQMPPWHIDRSVGVQKFKNDLSLTDEQVDTIVRWVDGGSLQGDPKDLPPAKPLVTDNEWQAVRDGFGKPDLVVKSSECTMPAEHQDVWYRPMSDIPLNEPRWVKLVEIRPTNLKSRKIIHHSIAYLILNNDPEAVNTGTANGPDRFGGDDLVNRRPQLMEWAIGKGYDLFRPGTGKLLVPGEKISWDQHIHAVGEEVTGGSEIGIWFYKKGEEPKKRSYLIGFTGIDRTKMLDIPPNSMAMTEGFTVLKENALIENFQPHFHLRGKSMQVEAILPDGSKQVISYVGNFNFNWMTNYIYDDDAAPLLPKGTVIHVTAWYDNTKANKNNPDSDQWVGYGDRTVDEMAHAWMNVVYFNDVEYKALQAERKAKTVKTTNDAEKQQ